MQLLPLMEVASQIKPGLPLAWGIRDGNGKLLLARGHRVADTAMLNALLSRGMFVDAAEMRAALAGNSAASRPREKASSAAGGCPAGVSTRCSPRTRPTCAARSTKSSTC
jgi:hypothetical protein